MRWDHWWSTKKRAERAAIEPILERGGDAKVKPRPPLLRLAEPYYLCFTECCDDRGSNSMGFPLPILRASVSDWLDEHRITDFADRQEFRYLVREMDRLWCKLQRIQIQREINSHSSKPTPIEVEEEVDDEDDEDL